MSTTPTENWPKPYLLQIHSEAVKHGFLWVGPISESDATSLRQRCYRIRRRSDKGTASFIPPEYHLVTFGRWEDVNGGRVPVIYNAKPDGSSLPVLTPASGEEIEALIHKPDIFSDQPLSEMPVNLSEADLQIDEEDIGGLVEKMRKAAQNKVN